MFCSVNISFLIFHICISRLFFMYNFLFLLSIFDYYLLFLFYFFHFSFFIFHFSFFIFHFICYFFLITCQFLLFSFYFLLVTFYFALSIYSYIFVSSIVFYLKCQSKLYRFILDSLTNYLIGNLLLMVFYYCGHAFYLF